jgi:hypothetical protein
MGGMRNIYETFVRKPEGKGQFVRPRRGWEDNNKTDVRVWTRLIHHSGGLL